MATRSSHNKNSSAVKRILSEARELQNDTCTDYFAAPLEEDIFEWHCTIRGPPGTEFEGGLYHCRVLLPSEYPFKAPSIMVLTPNGRFELNKKICISFTSYHEELWQPAWGVRTAIVGLQGFFPLKGEAAVGVGAVEYPTAERKRLAALSREWTCPDCKTCNLELLPDPPTSSTVEGSSKEGESRSEEPISEMQDTLPLEVPVAPPHPSLAMTSIPGAIPPLADPASTRSPNTSSYSPSTTLLSTTLVPSPIPPVPVSTVATAPSITPGVNLNVGRAPTPAPSSTSAPTVATPSQTAVGQSRPRSPIILDAAIIFFSMLIVIIAGKRFMTVWDLETDGGY